MERVHGYENLTLTERWYMPTRLAPTYYWPATRNGVSSVPGIATIIFTLAVIKRKPGVYKQYQYTVMLITFGGFILMLPVSSFNWTVSLLLTIYDGGVRDGVDQNDWNASYAHSFQTSVWGCSLAKQTTHATMNSNFCMGFIISLMRYLLLLHGIEMNWKRIIACCIVVMSPNALMLCYVMFFGAITQNDCCERILEVPEVKTPIYFYSYLAFIIVAALLINIRTLLYLLRMRREHGTSTSSDKRNRNQLNLTLGFLLQSLVPLFSFGSFVIFITMYLQGVLGPDWFSTYTNIFCFLSTLFDPIAAMAFVPVFRNEALNMLRCRRGESSESSSAKKGLVSKTISVVKVDVI